MKSFLRVALASAALVAAAMANAAPVLQVNGGAQVDVRNNDFAWIGGPIRTGGTLSLSEAATVTVAYLGREAGFSDTLFNWGGSSDATTLFSTGAGGGVVGQTAAAPVPPSAIGSVFSFAADAGDLLFNFLVAATGTVVRNGATSADGADVGFWSAASNVVYLLLDDGGGGNDADYDDMVVRLTVAAAPAGLVPTPEPQTLALILAGLVMIGFITRRRLRG